jgi:hypothetical protein
VFRTSGIGAVSQAVLEGIPRLRESVLVLLLAVFLRACDLRGGLPMTLRNAGKRHHEEMPTELLTVIWRRWKAKTSGRPGARSSAPDDGVASQYRLAHAVEDFRLPKAVALMV